MTKKCVYVEKKFFSQFDSIVLYQLYNFNLTKYIFFYFSEYIFYMTKKNVCMLKKKFFS